MEVVKNFDKSTFGYKPEEVDKHLQSVQMQVSSLEKENKEQSQKIEILIEKIQEYRKDEEGMKNAIITAQKVCSTIVNEAKEKAEKIVAEAHTKADALVRKANADKIEAIEKLKLETLNEQRNLKRLQREVSDFKSKVISSYKAHLDLLTNLPSLPEEEQVETNDETPTTSLSSAQENISNEPESNQESTPIQNIEQNEQSNFPEQKEVASENSFEKTRAFNPAKLPNASLFSNISSKSNDEKFGELKFGNKD